jgi:hypothetical protein
MPSISPITASGSRDLKRPRPVPKLVREAIKLMVHGLPDDPDGKPIDFVTRPLGISAACSLSFCGDISTAPRFALYCAANVPRSAR